MDYVLIELMLRDQETADPNWRPFILFNTVVKFGKETEFQEIKNELRKYYLELKDTFNERGHTIPDSITPARLTAIKYHLEQLINEYYFVRRFKKPLE